MIHGGMFMFIWFFMFFVALIIGGLPIGDRIFLEWVLYALG